MACCSWLFEEPQLSNKRIPFSSVAWVPSSSYIGIAPPSHLTFPSLSNICEGSPARAMKLAAIAPSNLAFCLELHIFMILSARATFINQSFCGLLTPRTAAACSTVTLYVFANEFAILLAPSYQRDAKVLRS